MTSTPRIIAPSEAAVRAENVTVAYGSRVIQSSLDFTIAKADYDMSEAKWDYIDAFIYDGQEKTVCVTGLPQGVTASYTGNKASAAGDYTAKAVFTYDETNFNAPTLEDLSWKIENNWDPTEYTLSGEGWLKADLVITADEGYSISRTNSAAGDWTETLTESQETAQGKVTFYLKNKETGAISLAKEVGYRLDTTVPTGTIAFDERTGWQEFLNNISFNLFYKSEVTVTIDSADAVSGVKSVEYFASRQAMNLDQVKAITDWTAYSGGVAVTLEDAKQFVYYARITDNAGISPKDESIVPGGPDGLFSTLPIKAMITAIQEAGLPASVSNTAGTFVCNDVLYSLLHHYAGSSVRCGFIHVPWLPEQGEPNLSLQDTVKALELAIGAL